MLILKWTTAEALISVAHFLFITFFVFNFFRNSDKTENIQEKNQREIIEETKKELEQLQVKLQKMMETETAATQYRLANLLDNTENKLDKLNERVQDLLNNVKSSTLETLTKVHTEIEKRFGNKLEALSRLQAKSKKALSTINEEEIEESFDEVVRVTNETKNETNIVEKDVNNYYSNITDNIIKTETQTCESVLTDVMDNFICHLHALIRNLLDDHQELEPGQTGTIQYKEYDIQTKGDYSKCDITDCCEINDSTIIVTDWNNSNIKRLNENFEVTDACSLPGLPWAVVAYSNNEVLVSLNLLQRIQWVAIEDDTLVPTKSFKVNQPCKGIACCWDKIYVSCGGNGILQCEGQIQVYDINGNFLQIILRDHLGHNIVSDPQHLLVIQFKSDFKLFIADKDKGLISIDVTEGFQTKECKHNVKNIDLEGYISEPKGLCLDRTRQHMYISDFQQDNIIRIKPTEHDYNIATLRTAKIKQEPRIVSNSVGFIEGQKKLIQTTRNSNVIKVYDMSKEN